MAQVQFESGGGKILSLFWFCGYRMGEWKVVEQKFLVGHRYVAELFAGIDEASDANALGKSPSFKWKDVTLDSEIKVFRRCWASRYFT